jgi:hypothetical protein
MDIDKLKSLTAQILKTREIIQRIQSFKDDEYLCLQISVSNGYDSEKLAMVDTEKDPYLHQSILNYHREELKNLWSQLKELN